MSNLEYPDNSIYYRLCIDSQDKPSVVEMQWFDEYGYDQYRFINDEKYETEAAAELALLDIKRKTGIPLTNLERMKAAVFLREERNEI